VDADDGGAVLIGADPIGADLHHRDDAAIQVDAEAGQGQGLHVAHHLLGRLVRSRQHVHLTHPPGLSDDPHGVDRGQAGEGLLEFPMIHGCLPRRYPTT